MSTMLSQSRLFAGRVALAIVAVVFTADIGRAANIYFEAVTGAQDFSADANWVGGIAPTNVDRAFVNTSLLSGDFAFLTGPMEVQNLTLGEAAGQAGVVELRSGGNLTLAGAASGAGRVASIGLAGAGTVRLLAGSSLTMSNGDTRVGDAAGSIGRVDQAAGSAVALNGSLNLATFANSAGEYAMSGGTLDVATFMIVGRQGAGSFIQTDGVVTINRNDNASQPALFLGSNPSGNGYYEIRGGSLNVADATNAGLRLGGASSNGTLKIVGDASTVSIGTQFVQNNGSTLAFEIGAGISPVDVGGGATLAGTLAIDFSVEPMVGQQFTLLTYGGSLTGAFTNFDSLVDGPLGADTISLALDYGSGADSSIVVSVTNVVPEPTSAMLVGICVALSFCTTRRWRQRTV